MRRVITSFVLAAVLSSAASDFGDAWKQATEQGLALQRAGRYAEASTYFTEAVKLAGDNAERRTMAEHNLAAVAHYRGDYARAEQLYRQVLKFWSDTNNQAEYAKVLTNLGVLYRVTGRLNEAEAAQSDALKVYAKGGLDHTREGITAVYNLAEVL